MTKKRKLTPFRKKYLRFNTSEQRRKLKRQSIEYKGGKCELCGYNKCIQALTFHHLDPSKKDFGISNSSTRSFANIKSELDKCILLCANCHAEEHAKLDEDERQKTFNEIESEKQKINPSIQKECFNCQKQILVYASRNAEKNFCSRACRDDYFNNDGWPSNQELLAMRNEMSVKEIEAKIGKGWRKIYLRLSKLAAGAGLEPAT